MAAYTDRAIWLLPRLPVYGELAMHPQQLVSLDRLVSDGKLKRHFPVGCIGRGVRTAEEFPELILLFKRHNIIRETEKRRISFPEKIVQDLHKWTSQYPATGEDPTDSDTQPIMDYLNGRSETPYEEIAAKLSSTWEEPFPSLDEVEETTFHSTMSEGPPEREDRAQLEDEVAVTEFAASTPSEAIRASSSDPNRLLKVWFMDPEGPVKERAKVPQSMLNLEKLISSEKLKPTDYIRHKDDPEFMQAGMYEQLWPLFQEIDPEFSAASLEFTTYSRRVTADDDTLDQNEEPRVPPPVPGSKPGSQSSAQLDNVSEEFLKSLGVVRTNFFHRATEVGVKAGLFALVPMFLIKFFMFGFNTRLVNGANIFLNLPVRVIQDFVLTVGWVLLISHFLHLVAALSKERYWEWPKGAFFGGGLGLAYGIFQSEFGPVVPFLGEYLLWGTILSGTLTGAMYGILVTYYANNDPVPHESVPYWEFTYEAPEEVRNVAFSAVILVVVVALDATLLMRFRAQEGVVNFFDNDTGLVVFDLKSTYNEENDVFVVTGTVMNDEPHTMRTWIVDLLLEDSRGNLLTKGRIQNKQFWVIDPEMELTLVDMFNERNARNKGEPSEFEERPMTDFIPSEEFQSGMAYRRSRTRSAFEAPEDDGFGDNYWGGYATPTPKANQSFLGDAVNTPTPEPAAIAQQGTAQDGFLEAKEGWTFRVVFEDMDTKPYRVKPIIVGGMRNQLGGMGIDPNFDPSTFHIEQPGY